LDDLKWNLPVLCADINATEVMHNGIKMRNLCQFSARLTDNLMVVWWREHIAPEWVLLVSFTRADDMAQLNRGLA
jgi:hypothetical protein